MSTTITAVDPALTRHLDDEILGRMRRRLVSDLGKEGTEIDEATAEGAFNELLPYLADCNGDGKEPPSRLVDKAWHTFLVYNWHYVRWCQRTLGRIIYHEPTDSAADDPTGSAIGCKPPGCRDRDCVKRPAEAIGSAVVCRDRPTAVVCRDRAE